MMGCMRLDKVPEHINFEDEAGEPRPPRRTFLMGAGAAALAGGALTAGAQMFRGRAEARGEEILSPVAEAGLVSALRNAPLFRQKVFRCMSGYERPGANGAKSEIAHTLENCEKYVDGHPGVTYKHYLESHIMTGEAVARIPHTVRQGIKLFIVGLASEESRFSNTARKEGREPDDTARGILQIMPPTYRGLGENDESIMDFPIQVETANEHFRDIYLTLIGLVGTELNQIRDQFFGGDQERFEREFLTLAVIDSYHAGQGEVVKNLQRFGRGEFSLEEAETYDVYTAFAFAAARPDTNYSDFSAGYTQRVAAFTLLHLGVRSSDA